MFFERGGQQNKGVLILKYGVEVPATHFYWGWSKILCKDYLFFNFLMTRKRVDFKSSLDVCTFMP